MSNEGYHEPIAEISDDTRDMHRAIVSLMEELEAVDWYNQRIDACKDPELASILQQRPSISAVRGYSSLSIMFLSNVSAINSPASGSIQVVTKVARLSRELPSSINSSWMNR